MSRNSNVADQSSPQSAVLLFAGDEIGHDVADPGAGLQRAHQQRDERRPEEARLELRGAAELDVDVVADRLFVAR